MSLVSRINRLADQLGSQDAPKRVVITTEEVHHGITLWGWTDFSACPFHGICRLLRTRIPT